MLDVSGRMTQQSSRNDKRDKPSSRKVQSLEAQRRNLPKHQAADIISPLFKTKSASSVAGKSHESIAVPLRLHSLEHLFVLV